MYDIKYTMEFLKSKAALCELRYLKYVVEVEGGGDVSPERLLHPGVLQTGRAQTPPELHHSQTNLPPVFMRGWQA